VVAKSTNKVTRWALALALGCALQSALAQSEPRQNMSAEEMIKVLAIPETRNIRIGEKRLDLMIFFEFDSSNVSARSQSDLSNLATAMKSDFLHGQRFVIEGHTDAVGSAAYNESLSRRRSESVVAVLVEQGVTPALLRPEGHGFRKLLDKANPNSPRNRRVTIVTSRVP